MWGESNFFIICHSEYGGRVGVGYGYAVEFYCRLYSSAWGVIRVSVDFEGEIFILFEWALLALCSVYFLVFGVV